MADDKITDLWGGGEDSEQPPGEAPQVEMQGRGMLSWDLLFDFHAMIEELEQTEGIVDVHSVMHEPVPLFTIETIEHGLGIRVPERIRSFYMVCDGLEFRWSFEKDSEVIPGGGAHLFDFATVFDTWLNSLWQIGEEFDEEQRDFLWTLRGFDRTYPADLAGKSETPRGPEPSQMVVMCVEEEYPTYDLFMHDMETRTSRLLDASLREYFDCLFASRGTYGWQRLLLENTDPEDAGLRDFFEITDRLFPGSDLDPWRV